jgi:hypothetical protein
MNPVRPATERARMCKVNSRNALRVSIAILLSASLAEGGAIAMNSWQVVGPGLADSDARLVVQLAPPDSDAYVRSDRPSHAQHFKASSGSIRPG